MSPRHPAKRRIAPQVADAISVAEWWQCERAQARYLDRRAAREQATTRLLQTLAWCLVTLTVALIAVTVLDALTGGH